MEEPGADPGTLAPQCESNETTEEVIRDTDKPLSPNLTNEVAVSETDLKDEGTVSANVAGELSVVAEAIPGEEKEGDSAMVGDGNPCVKEEEVEVNEGPMVEVECSPVRDIPLGVIETETEAEDVIGGEEVSKEEGSEMDQAVKKEEHEDDQMEVSIKDEVESAVKTGSGSEGGATEEEKVVILGGDDTMPKEEEGVEHVEQMDKAEGRDEDVTQTVEEAAHLDQEVVHSEMKNEEIAELQPEDANPTQDEVTNIDEPMLDDPGGDNVMEKDVPQTGDGDKAMNEDLSEDGDGDKVMDEDLTQDGDGDNAANEPSASLDGDGLDAAADDDQAAKHEEEAMGTNDEKEDEDDDDPPPLSSKKKGSAGKKRGRPTRIKKGEEELCFICFDGGELVVCDRRGCPKVYHPSCVNRDEAFFRTKGKWSCGWHICSECQKPARLMCYTCTYSLCKGCMKGSEFLSIRGNMGFCPSCLATVTMIERYERGEKDALPENVNFEDKSSWEFLFRDYWLEMKEKQSLTLEEILDVKSQQKTPLTSAVQEKETSDDQAKSDNSSAHRTETEETSSKRKPRKRLKQSKTIPSSTNKRLKTMRKDKTVLAECSGKRSRSSNKSSGTHWASNELLDFVAHMRNGDRSVISQFDVQALLLEYIKKKNLRDPRRKSQIICDRMLENLFGKERVGHFEMLKLLESHFLEASPTREVDEYQGGGVVDPEPDPEPENSEGSALVTSSEKKRKGRVKGTRAMQGNLDDYAAIDMHNIGLIYLRRNLMEEIVDSEPEAFEEKVLGSFVRIRVPTSVQRQDMYRLVQVVGTGRAAEKYKMGKKMTDITLEIVHLDKQEIITLDTISNQEFTEEECKRLRQSIKCDLIPRLTVGEVQDKARVLQAIKVNDWIESEKMRLSHLRDRASETGRRKELRECVEKLQRLNTPEERLRRMREMPEIHADPTMGPDYESAEEVEPEVVKKDQFTRRDSFGRRGSEAVSPSFGRRGSEAVSPSFGRRGSEAVSPSFGRRGSEAVSPHKGGSGFSGDNWRGGFSGDSWKRSSRNQNEDFMNSLPSPTTPTANRSAHPWSSERERERDRDRDRDRERGRDRERERERQRERERERERDREREKERNFRLSSSHAHSEQSQTKVSTIDESEKMWCYRDPAGKTQGPFSMVQLRKWNSSKYFPPTLEIWRFNEKQEDSILLTDALNGRFHKAERNAAASYAAGQQSGGDEDPRKSVKAVGGNELKIESVVNYGATNPVPVSPAFAKAGSGHALDRSGSFSAEGSSRLPSGTSQVSYPPTENTPNQSNIQHKSDPSITISSEPNSTSNTASVGPAQQISNNSDWATAAAAAAMAQQMAAMGTNSSMTWNPQMPVQGSANTSWGGMVGPTGMNMNMNMGWGAPNFNMGMGMPNPANANMNYAWGAQAMQPATTASWGALMPGNVNPVNQHPTWGMQAPNGGNWAVGPAQGPSVPQNPISAGPVQGNENANVDLSGGDWRAGICRFYENGHCKKGSGCNYYHPPAEKQ